MAPNSREVCTRRHTKTSIHNCQTNIPVVEKETRENLHGERLFYTVLRGGGGFGTKTLELIYLDSSAEREGSDTLSVTYPPSRLLCTQIRGRGATMAVPATRRPLNPSLYTGACLPARCTLFSSVDPPLLIDSNVSMPSSGNARHPHPSLFDGSRDRHPVPVPP